MANPTDGIWDRRLVWSLFAAWALSLALPVAYQNTGQAGYEPEEAPGWFILLIGFLGPLIFQFGWFTNIFFLAFLNKLYNYGHVSKQSAFAALFTLILLVNTVFWRNIPTDSGSGPIELFGPGYYLWFSAVGAAAILILARYRQSLRLENKE